MNALTRPTTVFAGLGLQGGRVAAWLDGTYPIPPHRAVLPGSHAGRRLRRRVYHGPYVAVGPAETVVLNLIQEPGSDHYLNIEVPGQARDDGIGLRRPELDSGPPASGKEVSGRSRDDGVLA